MTGGMLPICTSVRGRSSRSLSLIITGLSTRNNWGATRNNQAAANSGVIFRRVAMSRIQIKKVSYIVESFLTSPVHLWQNIVKVVLVLGATRVRYFPKYITLISLT